MFVGSEMELEDTNLDQIKRELTTVYEHAHAVLVKFKMGRHSLR